MIHAFGGLGGGLTNFDGEGFSVSVSSKAYSNCLISGGGVPGKRFDM